MALGQFTVRQRHSGKKLERENRPEFRTVILPFVARLPGNRVRKAGYAVFETGGIERLLKTERDIRVQFVVKSANRHLAHLERQHSLVIGVVQVAMYDLVLAQIEIELPTCVVAFGISVKPARERQSEIDESAKGAGWALGSDHDIAVRAGCRQGYCDRASQLRSAGGGCYSVQRRKRDWIAQPAHVGEEGIDLAAEEEAQVAAEISAGHQREPARG